MFVSLPPHEEDQLPRTLADHVENRRSLHCAPPDFLLGFVGATCFMRFSLKENRNARRELAAIDPNLTVIRFHTYDSEVAGNFNQDRLIARLTSLFGLLALVLASVGLYGVMSYIVARRTSEIGIRMALGAARTSVVAMVLRSVLWQILIGFAVGIPAALFAGRLMSGLLYGMSGYDPIAFFGATATLAACATVAGVIPARRAASIDPMQALRVE